MTDLKDSILFSRAELACLPLSKRRHDLDLSCILPLERVPVKEAVFHRISEKIICAKKKKAAIILMMGAHVIREGVQAYLIDLMEKGYLSCIATNGAGLIHDYEFALIGATTESVADYIKDGRFGLWKETGCINDIVSEGARLDMGLGEVVGKKIEEEQFPSRKISLLATGYRLEIPITVHVGIGYDILFEHPNCDGAAYGATSYLDFLKFTKVVESLQGGVVMNFGSAVMAPEIFLKALSMARNRARQKTRSISDFTTLVCDLISLPQDYHREPPKSNPHYYFRPWKTMLIRTVADGGMGYYVQGRHSETIPQLWTSIEMKTHA